MRHVTLFFLFCDQMNCYVANQQVRKYRAQQRERSGAQWGERKEMAALAAFRGSKVSRCDIQPLATLFLSERLVL